MKLVKPLIILSFLGLFLYAGMTATAITTVKASNQVEQQQIGEMIQKLQWAIKSPDKESALEVIHHYGTDSRYYLMIRGWLVQELKGVMSQLSVQQSESNKAMLQHRAATLRSAIRSIDLE